MFNSEDNNGNKGNKGKFSDRLKKMRRDRLKKNKKKISLDDDDKNIKKIGRNVLKVVLALPSMVYTNVVDESKKEINTLNEKTFVSKTSKLSDENRSLKVKKIKEIDVSILKKEKDFLLRNFVFKNEEHVKDTNNILDTQIKKEKLQKEILDLIKKNLVNSINELEILQSDFYVLNELGYGEIYLSECKQDIKEIKKLLSKVKTLKEKYDYLKDNIDFEYMLEYDDNLLIDKILELKDLCTKDEIRHTIEDYKILDEYKYLYLKIDKLQEDMIKYDEYKREKEEELRLRDIDFDQLKQDLYNVDKENDRYNSFVMQQQLLLNELDEKVSKIDSYEKVTYRLKGFNQLLGNSFKYLGLLLVNPLKGLIPGIATQTLVTKNIISNLYKNLEFEEERKMVYEAIDFSNAINNAINNLDDTSSLVDSTLKDVVKLKNKYIKEFSPYERSFSGYQEAIKKINKMENAILGNKLKVEAMKQRMKEKERENNNKLKMVKKLNSSNNN